MRKLFSSSSGIGLMEVIIAAGLIGGLSLVVTQLMSNSQKSVNHLETSSDILTTVQGIQSVLSKPENCSASFQGKNASNHPNAAILLKKTSPGGVVDDYKTIQSDPNLVYGQRKLKIKSYSLSDAAQDVGVNNLGTTHLVIEFSNAGIGLRKEIAKRIPLKVEVDGSGNILSCVALSHDSDTIWSYTDTPGDIFYSGGKVGIGTSHPKGVLTVAGSSQAINVGVGSNSSGYELNLGLNDDGVNFETSSSIRGYNFKNANGTLATIKSNGNVGLGESNPKVKLDVDGEIKLGSTILKPCDSSVEGTMRYNKSIRAMEYCGGDPLMWRSMSSNVIGCNWNGVKTNTLNVKDGKLRGDSVCFRVTCTNGVVTRIDMGNKNSGYACGG